MDSFSGNGAAKEPLVGDREVRDLLARVAQALRSGDGGDPAVAKALAAALATRPSAGSALHNALGLVETLGWAEGDAVGRAGRASGYFQRALAADGGNVMAGLNLAEALVVLGQDRRAVESAQHALAALESTAELDDAVLASGHFSPVPSRFDQEWERAGLANAGNRAALERAKRDVLGWRLHTILADLSGDIHHYYEAAQARPDLPCAQAALGCALARAGRVDRGLPHLRRAAAGDPGDRAAAVALGQALQVTEGEKERKREGETEGRREREMDRGEDVRPTFVVGGAVGASVSAARFRFGAGGGVSLCIIAKNEEENLPRCLGSVKELVDEGLIGEIIVVDTGSTDRTREVAREFGAKVYEAPWSESFSAARNETLRHASGAYCLWMDADDELDDQGRSGMRGAIRSLNGENVALAMKCLCLADPVTRSATTVDHVRLFPNLEGLAWRFHVHEQILGGLREHGTDVRPCGVVIRHTGYQDPALRRRKLERDLRLLKLDAAEQPEHPFVLFNLGMVHQELGLTAEAVTYLRRSIERSQPGDSIVRKLYTMLAQCQRKLGQTGEALAACRTGRQFYPDDAELLFQEALLWIDRKEWAAAEDCLVRLIHGREGAHFASVADGLRGYQARHNLGLVYREQGRLAEAEAQWRAAVAERGDFGASWLGLGEVYLEQGRWEEVEKVVVELERGPEEAGAAALRARGHMARKEFAEARAVLEAAIERRPESARLWEVLSHALLQEGKDWERAERALRKVLELQPGNAEARRNLEVLLRQQGREQ